MNLTDPGTLKTFLERHSVSIRKGLGQHFLCSRSTVEAIASEFRECQGLLEIGPGPGVLTSRLSSTSKLIALEVDPLMVSALAESAPLADVRLQDALKIDLQAILDELPEPRGVVSNLPYYITAPLINRIASVRTQWSVAVLMMQREVAEKIVAPVGDRNRGSLSVYLQALFEIRTVVQVPAGCFFPPPKVDSTVLRFQPNGCSYSEEFFRIVRGAFTQPRKTLANNLSSSLSIGRNEVLQAIESVGLDALVRPQALDIDQFNRLTSLLSVS